jgi:hypothetical protein
MTISKRYFIGRYVVSKHGDKWLTCYALKRDYCISEHEDSDSACDAARRYDNADMRRRASHITR